jgi:hypothetical protein
VGQFQKHPYHFLYERDIQCQMFAEMRSKIPESIPVPRSEGEPYDLSLVYSEYGSRNSRDRIDLVCLNPDAIPKAHPALFGSQNGYDNYLYSLPILVGIELKYVQMGYKGYSKSSQHHTVLQVDHDKLCPSTLESWMRWLPVTTGHACTVALGDACDSAE